MKASEIIKQCQSYFHGFSDVIEHKTAPAVMVGVLKILSYILVLPPLIFVALYFANRRVAVIEITLDALLDNSKALKTENIYAKTIPGTKSKFKADELVNYLIGKLDLVHASKKELERFQKAFYLLDFDSQALFFNRLAVAKDFTRAIDVIPRDLEYLNFSLGGRGLELDLATWDESQSQFCACLFFQNFSSFHDLKKVKFDLSALGFYCKTVELGLQGLLKKPPVIIHQANPDLTLKWEGVSYAYSCSVDMVRSVCLALSDIRKFVHEYPNVEWHCSLMNMDFGCTGQSISVRQVSRCFSDEPDLDLVVKFFAAP